MKITREELQAIENHMSNIPQVAGMYTPVLVAWCRALLDDQDGAEARANRTSYTVGETEWAHRIAVAEQRFVDEYDAHQETRTLLTDLYMKQLRADAAQMREYGISYHGLRTLLAEYDGGELSIGRVLELLRAAAREMAKEEIAELKARIVTLEAMKP